MSEEEAEMETRGKAKNVGPASCANCGTEISDAETMVTREGQAYCCPNCATLALDEGGHEGPERCAHCGNPIVDTSTHVTEADATYCCENCAVAAAQTTPRGV